MTEFYRIPDDYEKRSAEFRVVCDGTVLDVNRCDVSAFPLNKVSQPQRSFDQTEPSSFIRLGSDGEVTLQITPKKAFDEVTVRPLSKNITPQINGGTVTVTFPCAGQYSVEFDGVHHVLAVFVNPIKDFGVKPDDENTLYFGAGVHYLPKVTELSDGATVYIDKDAVVYGGFAAIEKKNIRILGYGILDNTTVLRGQGGPLFFSHCENVQVEGVTVVNSAGWSIHFAGCKDVIVRNIKLIGMWRYNSDGCDFTNCTNAAIYDSFLRNFDDCIVVKGMIGNYTMPVQHIHAENCVLWCDWGRALELGAETCAPVFTDVSFENCDIIHGDAVMLDIQHGDSADFSDIRFNNIRIEYMSKVNAPVLQTEPDQIYVNPNENHMPALFVVNTIHTMWSKQDRTGNIENVSFKDIFVTTDGRIPPSNINAYAKDTTIRGVHFENIVINGKKCLTLDELNIQPGENVSDVTVK